MAFAPSAPPKSLSTILLELYLNRSLPTDSAEEPKKRGLKIRPMFRKLLKTNIEKMPVFCLSIMLMKTNKLNHYLHYVDENKWLGGNVSGGACQGQGAGTAYVPSQSW